MPIFEYACRKCAHRFETLVMGATKPNCPSCHGKDLEKLVSVFAVASRSTGSSSEGSSSEGDYGGDEVPSSAGAPCGTCGDPRGPGSCAVN